MKKNFILFLMSVSMHANATENITKHQIPTANYVNKFLAYTCNTTSTSVIPTHILASTKYILKQIDELNGDTQYEQNMSDNIIANLDYLKNVSTLLRNTPTCRLNKHCAAAHNQSIAYKTPKLTPQPIITTLPNNLLYHSVAYGDGTFIAVSLTHTNKAARSSDGVNWTSFSLPSYTRWWSITYATEINTWVATSLNGQKTPVAYSTDGIYWSYTSLPWNGIDWGGNVTYGDGKFIVLDWAYWGAYSTDGASWQRTNNLPIDTHWREAIWGDKDGLFVGVGGDTDKAIYSYDGLTWYPTSLPTTSRWKSVTYGNGMFVAVANYTNAAYSYDGIKWHPTNMPSNKTWYSATFGDGVFVAIAETNANEIAYSTDGINWQTYIMPENISLERVTYGDGKFVAVGDNGRGITIDKDILVPPERLWAVGTNCDGAIEKPDINTMCETLTVTGIAQCDDGGGCTCTRTKLNIDGKITDSVGSPITIETFADRDTCDMQCTQLCADVVRTNPDDRCSYIME